MERREFVDDVAIKDVPTWLSKEEYVSDMVQRYSAKRANMKDVPIMLSMEEYVSDMGQRGILAAMKDVPPMPR